MAGVREELVGRGVLDDLALVDHRDEGGRPAGEAHLVGDDDHRHALPGELLHDRQDLADQLRIEGRGGLVEEHHLRVHHQCPGDRDPLLLAARQLTRVERRPGGQADARQHVARLLARLGLRSPADLGQADHHVLERAHVWKQVEALEDHPDLRPLACQLRLGETGSATPVADAQAAALEADLAGVDRLEEGQTAKHRALARSRRPEDRPDIAPLDGERHAAQDLVVAVALVDVDRLQERPGGRRSRSFDVVEERPLERHRAPSARRPPTTPPA